MVDFGTDISTARGLDPMFSLIAGPRVLGEAIARIYSEPQGSDTWHPERGRDLRRYLNEAMTPELLAQVQAEAEDGAELDERVASASVSASFNEAAGVLTLAVQVRASDGPFFFVFSLSEEGVALLVAR